MAQLSESITVGATGHIADTNALARKANYVYDIEDFGAVSGGTTDAAAAIQSAVTAAEADTFGTLYMPPKQYLIKTGLTVDGIHIEATGAELLVHNDVTAAALTIGTSSSSTNYKTLNLPNVKRQNRLWSKSTPTIGSDRGVVFVAADGCTVHVGEIQDFSYGLVLEGDGQGVAYNTFTPTALVDNAINLYLHAVNSGWANQNTFIGGRFIHNTEGEGSPVTGTRQLVLGSDANRSQSDNLFLGCSLEGTIFEFQLEVWSQRNQFTNCRWEHASPQTAPQVSWQQASASVFSRSNMIIGGAGVDDIVVTEGANVQQNSILSPTQTVWQGNWGIGDAGDSFDRILFAAALGRLHMGPGSSDPAAGGHLRGRTNDLWELTVAQLDVKDLKIDGDVGFYDTEPQTKPTVTGARDDGTALADLLTELATLGLITDSTTAS